MTSQVSYDNVYDDKIDAHTLLKFSLQSRRGWVPYSETPEGLGGCSCEGLSQVLRKSAGLATPNAPGLPAGKCRVRVHLSINVPIKDKCIVPSRALTARWTGDAHPTAGLPTALTKEHRGGRKGCCGAPERVPASESVSTPHALQGCPACWMCIANHCPWLGHLCCPFNFKSCGQAVAQGQ